jgi:hypothetical protein
MELLNAYERTMNAIDDLGPIVTVSSRSLLRIPRPTWLLRLLVVDHVDRTLDGVCRRYVARAALHLGASEDDDHHAARCYRESLPPIRRRTYTVLLATLAIVVASMTLPRTVAVFNVAGSPASVREFISALESQVTNPIAVDSILDQLGRANYDVFGYVVSGVLLIMYLLLRPVAAVFRVKRMIFNLYPDFERLPSVPISLSVRRTTGLYALEERLLREIGARRPPQLPFDLLVATLLIPFFVIGFAKDLNSQDPSTFLLAVVVEVLVLARLAWLFQTWRRRSSIQPGSISAVIVTNASRRMAARWALALSMVTALLSPFLQWISLFPAVTALLLARWSDAASTYSAGRYNNRRIALAAKLLACAGILLGLTAAVGLGSITFDAP